MTSDSAALPTRPIPAPDEASLPFFEGARAHRLLLMRCRACGTWRYPSRDRCDACWSTETEWEQASGRGNVYTFSVMHQLYHPGFKNEVPYNVAVVELEEGPRMTTNVVDCPNDAIRVGMPVEAVFDDVSADVSVPKIRPRGGG
jgi:uncharacterized OB-fold protein